MLGGLKSFIKTQIGYRDQKQQEGLNLLKAKQAATAGAEEFVARVSGRTRQAFAIACVACVAGVAFCAFNYFCNDFEPYIRHRVKQKLLNYKDNCQKPLEAPLPVNQFPSSLSVPWVSWSWVPPGQASQASWSSLLMKLLKWVDPWFWCICAC
jgi:hypothetical protein